MSTRAERQSATRRMADALQEAFVELPAKFTAAEAAALVGVTTKHISNKLMHMGVSREWAGQKLFLWHNPLKTGESNGAELAKALGYGTAAPRGARPVRFTTPRESVRAIGCTADISFGASITEINPVEIRIR